MSATHHLVGATVYSATYIDTQERGRPDMRHGVAATREGALKLLCRAISSESWTVALSDMHDDDRRALPLRPTDLSKHTPEQIVSAYWDAAHTTSDHGDVETWEHDSEQYATITRRSVQP